jgi:hypothetical protein
MDMECNSIGHSEKDGPVGSLTRRGRDQWVAASFEVSRAAPKCARVRGAWIKPEAHSYIDVKACAIAYVSAAVEDPKQKGIKKTDR